MGGPHKNGVNYVTLGRAMNSKNGVIYMRAGCTQSCSSVAPCNGCALNVQGDCAGSCDCTTGGQGSCTHTVSSQK